MPLKLTSPAYGIDVNDLKHGNCHMLSEKYICVCEKRNPSSNGQVAIVDLSSCSIARNNVKADFAMMHPHSRILAVRGTGTAVLYGVANSSQRVTY